MEVTEKTRWDGRSGGKTCGCVLWWEILLDATWNQVGMSYIAHPDTPPVIYVTLLGTKLDGRKEGRQRNEKDLGLLKQKTENAWRWPINLFFFSNNRHVL